MVKQWKQEVKENQQIIDGGPRDGFIDQEGIDELKEVNQLIRSTIKTFGVVGKI